MLHEDIYESFITAYIKEIKNMYGTNATLNKEYCKIISKKHFDRLKNLIDIQNVEDVIGGRANKNTLKIEPTIIKNVSTDNPIMQEEIFGPILPIIKFNSYEEAFKIIKKNPDPLAFYVFTENKNLKWKCAKELSFGGFVANDTIMHLANENLPFGGIGTSGLGNYHGKYSFDIFSKKTSFLNKSTKFDINLRYAPFDKKWKWIKRFVK
ncbi:aldehyde dehydrogenase 3h1 [Clostridium botulinum C str. Eklund]|nr:aldehyde dehydrogenase 3h1 [Clostridium botulinum C str. Eklund]